MTLFGDGRCVRWAGLLRIFFAVAISASAISRVGGANRKFIFPGLICFNENNSDWMELSSAQVGGGFNMPTVLETITINSVDGVDPSAGQEVHVSYGSAWINASVASGAANYTDGNGQFMFVVKGNGSAIGTALLTVTWVKNGIVLKTTIVRVSLISELSSADPTPASSLIHGFKPYHPIKYISTTTLMSGPCAQARADWVTIKPSISFQSGPMPQLTFSDTCFISATSKGRTYPETPIAIRFPKATNDSDPMGLNCYSIYCPVGLRHDLKSTAAHELGHALGLGHNLTNRSSLMYTDDSSYFVWKIGTPQTNDIGTLADLYP